MAAKTSRVVSYYVWFKIKYIISDVTVVVIVVFKPFPPLLFKMEVLIHVLVVTCKFMFK